MAKTAKSKARLPVAPHTRKAQHCRKCPGLPLRSQCVHSAAGKIWLESNPVTIESQDTPSSRNNHCRKCPDNPLRSECTHTSKGRAFLSAQAAQQRVDAISLPASQVGDPEPHTPPRRTGSIGIHLTTAPVAVQGLILPPAPLVTPDAMIDPHLLAISQAQLSYARTEEDASSEPSGFPATPATPATFPPSSPMASRSDSVSDRSPDADVTPAASSTFFSVAAKRKPTQANPFHGFVDGIKRGNAPYSIHRNKALPNVIENSRASSRRFTRLVSKIVEKCEDVSRETGCWLFLGAQHTSARGGTLSYASPRLRSEAQMAVGALATDFNSAVATLLSARRADAVELQRKYEAAQASKQAAEVQLTEQQRLIDDYRKQYGDLSPSTNSLS